MDDFLFSIELVKTQVLEDYRKYFPLAPKKKPMVHWGIEYEIRFMDEPIPEEEGMLSRRFMEITLKTDEEPTPAIIAREMILRGGKSVGAASTKAREKWWNGHKPAPKERSVQEDKELLDKSGYVSPEMEGEEGEEGQQTLPGLDDEEELEQERPAARQSRKPRVKRKSH